MKLPMQNRLSTNAALQDQLRNPNGVLSALLIMGGDIIHKALAQKRTLFTLAKNTLL